MHFRKHMSLIIFATITLLVLLSYYVFCQFYLYASDAYIEANVVVVSPEVSGRIERIYVKDLEEVKKNQLLFELDPTPYLAAQKLANAKLAQAEDKYASLIAQRKSAMAVIARAKADLAFQAKELDRYNKLSNQDLSSKEKLDQIKYSLKQSQSDLQMAHASLQNLNAQLGEKHNSFAPIEKARAELKLANYNLEHTKYKSIVDGHITSMLIREGDYVKAGDKLFALIDDSEWWVLLRAKENYLSNMTNNNHVTIWLPSVPDEKFEGNVYGAAWAVNRREDSSSAAKSVLPYLKQTEHWIQLAQRFPVRIPFDPKGHKLHFGANARVLVKLN